MRINIIFTLILAIATKQSLSCSCDTIHFDSAVEWADEIFVGSVVKVEALSTKDNVSNWRWKYTFNVTKKWKGSHNSEVEIYHAGTSCDPYFDIYQTEYLIYAAEYNDEGEWGEVEDENPAYGNLYTWLCARNVEKRYYDDKSWFDLDVKRLNSKFPEKIVLISSTIYYVIWIISGIILGVIFLIIKSRRRKRKISN